ncbi:serine hydrolase-like protein isoform 2-T2 [Pholidichthys leucotaenia]
MMHALKGVRHMTSSMKQAVSELSVPVPWGKISGKAWGPENGHPVLCLHGWSDNCGTFNTLIPLLPKAMQWTKFSIIGHSMGGNIGGMFSAVFPEMVNALILLDSYGFIPTDVKETPDVIRKGMNQMLEYEKKEEDKKRVYTFDKAVERLLAANQTLTEQSAKILLERGLVQVEGGVIFSRDFRINLKNVVRISLEQTLEMQSRIKASVLLILAEDGFEKAIEQHQKTFASPVLQAYRNKNHTIVTVPGDHHIHLNTPEVIAPLVSDFLQNKVLCHQAKVSESPTSKL